MEAWKPKDVTLTDLSRLTIKVIRRFLKLHPLQDSVPTTKCNHSPVPKTVHLKTQSRTCPQQNWRFLWSPQTSFEGFNWLSWSSSIGNAWKKTSIWYLKRTSPTPYVILGPFQSLSLSLTWTVKGHCCLFWARISSFHILRLMDLPFQAPWIVVTSN